MNKVLVTGASGFIGKACIDTLIEANQYEIHAVSARSTLPVRNGVHFHRLDLHDHAETGRLLSSIQPSHLLHLAWYAVPGKFWSSEENYKWVDSSLNLLQGFASAGGKRCVTAGSCAEYSWNNGDCIEDITPLIADTVYGKCKNHLHSMQTDFCREAGLSCAWGRVFHLYGPHEPQEKLFSSIILSLLNGIPARCTHGEQIRDYLYVKDVASAFIALLGSDYEGAVNIASGRPSPLKEVIFAIADKLNRRDLIKLGSVPTARNEPDVLTGNTSRITEEIGWHPHYSLDDGLNLTIEWWKSQLNKEGT